MARKIHGGTLYCIAIWRVAYELEDPDLVEVLERNTEPEAMHWIFALIDELPHHDFPEVLITLWPIWHS